MTRRIALLASTGAAAIALCTGCQGSAAGPHPAPAGVVALAPTAAGSSDSDPNQLNAQLDNVRSSLDDIQSQLAGAAAP